MFTGRTLTELALNPADYYVKVGGGVEEHEYIKLNVLLYVIFGVCGFLLLLSRLKMAFMF